MRASAEAPAIPPRLRRLLTAAWISLALHAAVIALVQVAPPASPGFAEPAIEARLVPARAAAKAVPPSPDAPAERVPARDRSRIPGGRRPRKAVRQGARAVEAGGRRPCQ